MRELEKIDSINGKWFCFWKQEESKTIFCPYCGGRIKELEKIEDDSTTFKIKPPTKLECPDYGEEND